MNTETTLSMQLLAKLSNEFANRIKRWAIIYSLQMELIEKKLFNMPLTASIPDDPVH